LPAEDNLGGTRSGEWAEELTGLLECAEEHRASW
jgi:hypothetical protein